MNLNRREVLLSLPLAAAAQSAPHSRFVYPGPDGKLLYKPDELGNTIPDFSYAGYGAGVAAIPQAPVKAEVAPAAGDAAARIQDAIDRVSAMPLNESGIRGAVLIRRGQYRTEGSVHVAASGVVLRGEKDAVLIAAGKSQRPLIELAGAPAATARSGRRILDAYVPVGARSFEVSTTAGLTPGRVVAVRRHSNAAWIHRIAMDRIAERPGEPGSTRQWAPFNLDFERTVTAIAGRRITVDAPIACAIEEPWGGGEVLDFDEASRIRNVGVENLSGISEFDRSITADYRGQRYTSDEEHSWRFIAISHAVNAWVSEVSARCFAYACVHVAASRSVTIRDSECLEPVSVITGERRYSFAVDGQLCLVRNCRSSLGRHDWVVGARVCGPNVFLRCASDRIYDSSEPHHRWSVGGLYDNVKSNIAFQDRQWMGTGHGWAGANYVAWNCEGTLICQNPPTAQNWAICQIGRKDPGAFQPRPDGLWEHQGHHVTPPSLYEAQLHGRIGG